MLRMARIFLIAAAGYLLSEYNFVGILDQLEAWAIGRP